MRFSIFTPTHRPDYLLDAYRSLCAQAVQDWEWVIVPNGQCPALPGELTTDSRVRIRPLPDSVAPGVIGAIKQFACQQCRGQYLVELDHDDLLDEHALLLLDEAIESNRQPEFLYSDFVEFCSDGTSHTYAEAFGWECYAHQRGDATYTAMRAFPLSAAALHQIFYAPNHIRVWRRDFYAALGGHNPALSVCDDQDLVIRTYLAGANMVHIPRVLYWYRVQAGHTNTHLERNERIQRDQQQIANQYVYSLIAEECRREHRVMIDLGGRLGCPPGYVSLDYSGGDISCDLRRGLPFADSSVGCIRAHDFLEHIPHCRDSACGHGAQGEPLCTVGIMNEFYRVLVPGGWLTSRTPSTDGRGAFQDPTHCSFWNLNSFWYYTRREQARYVPGINCRFQATRVWQAFPSEWHKAHNIPYVYADLTALKGQRHPGLVEI